MKKINFLLILFLLTLFCGNIKADPKGNWSENTQPFTEGSGTEQYPYIIYTPEQLAYMAVAINIYHTTYANSYYKLGANIDLGEHIWNIPIGTSDTKPFQGNFNGQNFKILNLISYYTGYSVYGLFGQTNDASIKNLVIEGGYIQGGIAGHLIGYAYRTIVENCSVKRISGSSGSIYIGGIIGYANETTVINSSFSGHISTSSFQWKPFSGGFIGAGNDMTILDCYSEGILYGGDFVGGFIGFIASGNNIITDCYSTCYIESSENVGGFIGNVGNSSEVTITGCRASGSVFGRNKYVGGFIGSYFGKGEIRNCISEGRVMGLEQSVGGFIGYISYPGKTDISDCRSTGSTEGMSIGSYFIGGFLGEYSHNSSNVTITHCSAEGPVTATLGACIGGFVGGTSAPTYPEISISGCFANGNVKGYIYVGGFGGQISGVYTNCFTTGTVEGNSNVGGFSGIILPSGLNFGLSRFFGCFAVGSVMGIEIIGGFAGTVSSASFSECYATGTVFGKTNTGAFIGYIDNGWESNFSNCYFDRQTTGLISASGTESEIEGIKALSTSELTKNSLSGFSENNWIFTAGYYPQQKVFTEINNEIFKLQSDLSVVPLKFENDKVTVNDEPDIVQLTDKTPSGDVITWSGSKVEIDDVAWNLLTLSVGEVKRTVTFRSQSLNSLGAIINNIFYNYISEKYSYMIECGSKNESIIVEIVFGGISSSMQTATTITLYANQPHTVIVTTPGGEMKTYTLVAEKHLPSEIFIQRWKDVLAINNNFVTNGGYNFTAYEWYKNGAKLPGTKGYMQESGGLSKSAEYTALLTTQQGDKLSTCPAVILDNVAVTSSVYPNPVRRGQKINVKIASDEQKNVVMQLFNQSGKMVAKQNLSETEVEIEMPEMAGQYILQLKDGDEVKSFKVVVE